MTKKTIVISAYPCCGKSYIVENQKKIFRGITNDSGEKISVADSDSSGYSWIYEDGERTDKRHPDFPNNYIEHIKGLMGKVDFIFVSSHKIVREALRDNNIEFVMVIPDKRELNEWMVRMYNREDTDEFINNQIDHWDEWLNEIEEETDTYSKLIKLHRKEFLSDVITDLFV